MRKLKQSSGASVRAGADGSLLFESEKLHEKVFVEGSAAEAQAVEDEHDEDEAAEGADDEFDRELVGQNDETPDQVAAENEERAEERRIGKRRAQVVALKDRDEIGNDEADVGDAPDDSDDRSRDHRGDGKTRKEHEGVVDAQILREVPTHADDVEPLGVDPGYGDERNDEINELVVASQNKREMANQPGRKRLRHVEAEGEEARDAADHVAEHDADQGHHHRVLHWHSKNEPDEDPGAENRCGKGEGGARPGRGVRHEEERNQDAELRRRDRGAGCRRNEFVCAELLHDEARNAHAHAGAEDGKKPREPGNQKKFKAFSVAGKQRQGRNVRGAYEKRREADDDRKRQQYGG